MRNRWSSRHSKQGRFGPAVRRMTGIASSCHMILRRQVAGRTLGIESLVAVMARTTAQGLVLACQCREMIKVNGACQFKTTRSVAILAFVTIVRLFQRFVAVGTLILDILDSVMAAMASDLGMLAF